MNDLVRLRRGEVVNPAEFPEGALEGMHDRLDAIAREQARAGRRDRVEGFLSWVMGLLASVALVLLVGLLVAEGMGWVE